VTARTRSTSCLLSRRHPRAPDSGRLAAWSSRTFEANANSGTELNRGVQRLIHGLDRVFEQLILRWQRAERLDRLQRLADEEQLVERERALDAAEIGLKPLAADDFFSVSPVSARPEQPFV
jgi:hypothetical protein